MIKKESIELLLERFDQIDQSDMRNYASLLARQNIFYEDIFNNVILDGLLVLNDKLEIEFANRSAYSLLGLPKNAIGKNIGRFFKELDLKELSQRKTSRQEIEIFYPQHRYVDLYISHNQEQKKMTLVLYDKTEHLQKSQIYFETEKMNILTMLAGGVAHELGNPLNSLGIHLQLLQRLCKGLDDKEKFVETISVAEQEVTRLNGIVKQFLDAVSNTHPILVPQDIKKLVNESIDFLAQELDDKQITVEKKWDNTQYFVKGDETQLKQAFYNVIKNASQAMVAGGELVVSISSAKHFLKVAFADSGGGISPQRLSKIFDCFQTDNNGMGTGLGLFIVSRVMREHNGRIDVDTNDRGTTFTLYFPLREQSYRLIGLGEKND